MTSILQRQPLTIKQQVEELKNWHKQQQSKFSNQSVEKTDSFKKIDENGKNLPSNFNSNSRIDFDEIPIKVASNNLNSVVEDNVYRTDSHLAKETNEMEEKDSKPKFPFLKKGEGIARFNMRPPPKRGKTFISKNKTVGLNLTKGSNKCESLPVNKGTESKLNNINSENTEEVPTLKVPDLKLNFTWKSILSGENPEDLLEKAINSNQLELMDPNSSIDSSTASLMEKLLAIGRNKLSRDREELRVFEAMEQHMLDSSFCSTSSYVNKLMENAVISTPNKDELKKKSQTVDNTSKTSSGEIVYEQIADEGKGNTKQNDSASLTSSNVPIASVRNCEYSTKLGNIEQFERRQNNDVQEPDHSLANWIRPLTVDDQSNFSNMVESTEELEQSLHVRFSEKVDYKSFAEQSQSVDSLSQAEDNICSDINESHEWNEISEDSSSCCSQCSKDESKTEDTHFNSHSKQLQINQLVMQNEDRVLPEKLNNGKLKANPSHQTDNTTMKNSSDSLPPLLIAKLKELEEEIKIFREENSIIRTLRERLENEHKEIQEEKRRLNLEKKKYKKEFEEEQKRLTSQIEEEKKKLAKEKNLFEKYSKSLTKTPSREERKEIQALREQLTEMKEELNKKESRWGAAQARVRNQVKVLEEDNKKLREEIQSFRKQAKCWELFSQKRKGKPFNNTKLIHAISEHISNIVLEDESKENNFEKEGYFNQKLSVPKTSTITQSELSRMYSATGIQENKINKLPSDSSPRSNLHLEDDVSKKSGSGITVENQNVINNSLHDKTIETLLSSRIATVEDIQNEGRCQKPCLETRESSDTIKEVIDDRGNVEIIFPNGNIKKMNKITGSEKYIYINGDVEEITHDGTIKYYFSKSRIWQTTLPDGMEIIDFPDGKVEKRHINGTVEIIYSNGNKKISCPDSSQEIIYTDGTRLKVEADKTQILILPNGQKEIHTEEWKRREYPDGTMKTLYPDGTTETVYSNGRVRLKDKYGNLVMDSGLTQGS